MFSTPPGLKPEQATQTLLTLGGESGRDIHSCLSAFRFLGSGTQSPGLVTWLYSTSIICSYRIPSHWPLLWESHIHSWKPVPTTSALTYPQNPSLLSATRQVEALLLLPSPLAGLTLQEKTDLVKWLKSYSWIEYPLLIKCDLENRKNNTTFHSKQYSYP